MSVAAGLAASVCGMAISAEEMRRLTRQKRARKPELYRRLDNNAKMRRRRRERLNSEPLVLLSDRLVCVRVRWLDREGLLGYALSYEQPQPRTVNPPRYGYLSDVLWEVLADMLPMVADGEGRDGAVRGVWEGSAMSARAGRRKFHIWLLTAEKISRPLRLSAVMMTALASEPIPENKNLRLTAG